MYVKSGWKESIEKYIRNMNGSLEDVEDIFQEGVRNFVMNIRSGRYVQQSSLRTYMTAICKNLWYSKLSRQVKLEEIKKEIHTEQSEPSIENELFLQERTKILKEVLSHAGEPCKKLLGLWSLGFSFKEIAVKTGSTEGAMRKQKHDCLKKLTAWLSERPELVKELTGN